MPAILCFGASMYFTYAAKTLQCSELLPLFTIIRCCNFFLNPMYIDAL